MKTKLDTSEVTEEYFLRKFKKLSKADQQKVHQLMGMWIKEYKNSLLQVMADALNVSIDHLTRQICVQHATKKCFFLNFHKLKEDDKKKVSHLLDNCIEQNRLTNLIEKIKKHIDLFNKLN